MKADVIGPVPPARSELVLADAGLWFGGPGGEGGDLRSPAAGHAPGGHLRFDLAAALAELAAHGLVDAGDLGDAVAVDLVEEDPGRAGHLVAEPGLEDRLSRVPLAVEGTAVERGAAPVGPFGDVEDHPVDVQPRVPCPAGAVEERRADEPLAGLDGLAGMATADQAGGRGEVALRFLLGGVDGVLDGADVVGVPERPEDRVRLGDRQGQVEARHRRVGQREPLAGERVPALEGGPEGVAVDGAGEPELLGEGA